MLHIIFAQKITTSGQGATTRASNEEASPATTARATRKALLVQALLYYITKHSARHALKAIRLI